MAESRNVGVFVLLVDDDPEFVGSLQEAFRHLLTEIDFDVIGSVKAALKRLTAKPCDVLLVNPRIGEDAGQILLRARQRQPDTLRIAVLSPNAPDDEKQNATLCLERPNRPEQFAQVAATCLQLVAAKPPPARGPVSELKNALDAAQASPGHWRFTLLSEVALGEIHLSAGKVVAATFGGSQGQDALDRIMEVADGWFERRPAEPGIRPVGKVSETAELRVRMPANLPNTEKIDPSRKQAPAAPEPAAGGRAPRRVAPPVPLEEGYLRSLGLSFALELDGASRTTRDFQCPDAKSYVSLMAFTLAKAGELAALYQWEPPLSVHFQMPQTEIAVLPFQDRTFLFAWPEAEPAALDRLNEIFPGSLDPTLATRPRLAGTIAAMKKVPGLHGFCIFNKELQVLLKKFAAAWSFELLQGTARLADQLLKVLALQKLAPRLIQIKFDVGSVFVQSHGEHLLLVICHSQTRIPLLKDCMLRITDQEVHQALL
ncbi:MAG: hypothetical protein JO317_00935 [Verrucomicrobiae bacterium]|nr:hypothetical protein [Verrucomicrobiae bacterium]